MALRIKSLSKSVDKVSIGSVLCLKSNLGCRADLDKVIVQVIGTPETVGVNFRAAVPGDVENDHAICVAGVCPQCWSCLGGDGVPRATCGAVGHAHTLQRPETCDHNWNAVGRVL